MREGRKGVLEALGVREMERERNVRNYLWIFFYGVDSVIIVPLLKEQ